MLRKNNLKQKSNDDHKEEDRYQENEINLKKQKYKKRNKMVAVVAVVDVII